MERVTVAEGTVGVYVADEREDAQEYRIGARCRVAVIVPVTGSGKRSVTVTMERPDSRVYILGFVSLSGDAKNELMTVQNHEAPETTSDLIVKSILRDGAVFSYQGTILVAKDAQKTDAYQRNENLLLSPGAWATSSPALEIMANDVRATHGATISSLDPDELWYLSTRGIGTEKASGLIVEGFLRSAFERISEDTVKRNAIDTYMRLPLARKSVYYT